MPVFLMSTMLVFLTLQGSCIDPIKCLASTSELATGTVVSDHVGMGRISYYFRALFQKGPCLNIL